MSIQLTAGFRTMKWNWEMQENMRKEFYSVKGYWKYLIGRTAMTAVFDVALENLYFRKVGQRNHMNIMKAG